MAIVMQMQSAQISEISGSSVMAELRFGTDGNMSGAPEYDLGTSSDTVDGSAVWDGDSSDGVESPWVDVSFSADSTTDLATWSMNNGSGTLSYDQASFGAIQQVQIRSGTLAQASMLWRSLEVNFYKNNQVVDTYTQQNGPSVDQTADPYAGSYQDLLQITPGVTDADKVVITGQVKMTSPEGVYPAENTMFSQILLFA